MKENLKIGDMVLIQIVGAFGEYAAKVVGFREPGSGQPGGEILEVQGWPMLLKPTDYILGNKINNVGLPWTT